MRLFSVILSVFLFTNGVMPMMSRSFLCNTEDFTRFAGLYQAKVSATQNVENKFKADRKLLQRLLIVVTVGRTVKMMNAFTHELSQFLESLLKPGGEINTTYRRQT